MENDNRRDLQMRIMAQVYVAGALYGSQGPPTGEDWRIISAWANCNAVAGVTSAHWELSDAAGIRILCDDEVLAANVRSHLYTRAPTRDSFILHAGQVLTFRCAGVGAGDQIAMQIVAERRQGVEVYLA
jgi:hypothetical protein